MSDARGVPETDLLYGLAAIGAAIGLTDRQAEHLIANGQLPAFKMGRTVCARRSTLAKHFAAQERAGMVEDRADG